MKSAKLASTVYTQAKNTNYLNFHVQSFEKITCQLFSRLSVSRLEKGFVTLLLIPIEFETVIFWLGAQRWTLDKLGIQYLHSRSQSDKQFRTLQVNRSTRVQYSDIASIAQLFTCHPRFLFRCYPPHRNIHTEERCTCEGDSTADDSYLTKTIQASVGYFACAKQWRNKGRTAQSQKLDPKNKK